MHRRPAPLNCPACGGAVRLPDPTCTQCAWRGQGDVIDTVDTMHGAARTVAAFYGVSPFPGYAPTDDATSVLDRGMATGFLRALDQAMAPDAVVLDLGCGTGQVAAVLALRGRQRTVVGADVTPEQLSAAAWFRDRATLDNLHLVRADLFSSVVADRAYDAVICRGVVHHTDDPSSAIRRAADRVAPGGWLALGYYDRAGRAAHRARVALSRGAGGPVAWLDPVLRRTDLDDAKRTNWIRDQYEHPVEHRLGLGEVVASIEAAGLAWVRTVPPLGPGGLLAPSRRPGWLGRAALGASWALSGVTDPDAGLVAVIARRPG